MKIETQRVMVMFFALALAMVGFLGLAIGDPEPPLTAPNVTIEDTFAPADDMNAYVGDTFMFMVEGYSAPHNNANITAEITIGPLATQAMTWNATEMYWEYEQVFPVDPTYVGDHVVNFTLYDTNVPANIVYVEETITLWHPVMLNSAFELPTFEEDMTTAWNITNTWLPMMDEADAYLTFGFGTDYPAPDGWTFEPVMDGMYTHWHVTPPMNFNGWQWVNVTAEDTNGISAYNVFNLTVGPVNDAPMIEYIMVGEEQLDIELWNYTWVDDVEGNMSEFRNVINLTGTEDMPFSFMVSAMDVETDMMDLMYDFVMYDDTDPYAYENDLNETNETIPYNFTLTPDMDANGMFWAMMNVTDDDLWHEIWLYIMFEAVNDAPTIMFDDYDVGDQIDKLTKEPINVSVTAEDVDNEMLTYMWYIDGDMVADWDMDYFLYNWSAEGIYNVSVKVNDGELDSEMIYFWANITKAGPEWTAADIVVNYTEAANDVAKASADGIVDYTFSDLRYTDEWAGIDITGIATELDGDNLVVTITFAAAPLEVSSGLTEFLIPYYRLYFVKSTFTEPVLNEATPDMDYSPDAEDIIWSDELEMYSAISGNDMVYTIPLEVISDGGVTPEEFNIFFNAYLVESKLEGLTDLTLQAGYDSAGLGAATHVSQPAGDDDDDDDDGFPWLIVVIIVIVLVIVIILVVVFMMKGKKGEEEEIAAPPEEEMPPAEGEEIPMEGEMPMEGEEPPMEGYEEPPAPEEGEFPAPEEPAPEEPVPEEPVPEEPVPEEPPEPVPPMPEEPAPPVPPQPEPPIPPQ